MSIRPIDVALTLQRTTDVNRSQTNEGIRPETVMQQSADKIQKDIQIQEQSVVQTNKVEESNVDRDGRGAGAYGGSGRKKKRSGAKDVAPVKHNGLLDVSI